MPEKKTIYQLKVTLKHSRPLIWRRILVPENITLYNLHEIIQAAMGWWECHLHMFIIRGQEYGDPEGDEFGERRTKNEKRYRLNQFGFEEKANFSYEYDFGDGWEHTILLEKILSPEKGVRYPLCVAGKRACPPEDVGGMWGYGEFLKAIAAPEHEQHDELLEWIGGEFDPEKFDLASTNENLSDIKISSGRKRVPSGEDPFLEIAEIQKAMADNLAIFMENMHSDQRDKYDALPLRRDMLTFLGYIANNRTVGTKSTGNLPLKAVYAICKEFVDPPLMEPLFGDVMHQIRTEDEVWPLVFVHHLAFRAYWVTGGQGLAWEVTTVGQQFTDFPSPVQVFQLIFHWFNYVDWSIAFPLADIGQWFPPDFIRATLIILLDLPVGEYIPYHIFADDLIAQSGLALSDHNPNNDRIILHSVFKLLVVGPMQSLGILECDYGPTLLIQGSYEELKCICLTSMGEEMLTLLRDVADGFESIHDQ